MTLVELLAALTIMIAISLAAFSLIDVVMRRTGEISNRVEATQRGRSAMDDVTRQVRSQVCVQRSDDASMTEDRAIYAVTPTSIAFFTDLSDESVRAGNTAALPQLRTLSFESGKLIERDYAASAGATTSTYRYAGYPGSPVATRNLLENVTAGGFRYWTYTTAATPALTNELNASSALTATQLGQIAKVSVSFEALAMRAKATDNGSAVFSTDIFVRSTDPNSSTPKPVCA